MELVTTGGGVWRPGAHRADAIALDMGRRRGLFLWEGLGGLGLAGDSYADVGWFVGVVIVGAEGGEEGTDEGVCTCAVNCIMASCMHAQAFVVFCTDFSIT